MEIDESLLEYRNYKFNGKNVEIPILTIKKGTLLFRYVYDIPKDNKFIKDMSEGSFIGIRKSRNVDSFCLPFTYNVFFYPYPYIMDTNKYLFYNKVNRAEMVLFETTKDLKVVLLLTPSKLRRISKEEENEILITCDNYEYCENLKGFYYDACFRKDFLEKNKDIMGYYGISEGDSKRFLKSYKTPKYKPFKKFVHFYKNDKNVGIPELVLYPRNERIFEDINIEIKKGKVYEYIKENEDLFNYKMIDTLKHFPYGKNDELSRFLNKDFVQKYFFNKLSGLYERF
jgi:hypothetical protein